MGDIRASLEALLPLLVPRLAPGAAQRRELLARAAAQAGAPVTTPLVAAREVTWAIGPEVAIVDEAIATSTHVRGFLDSPSPRQYSFFRGGALGWGMPAAVGFSLGLDREPVVCLVGDGAAMYSPQALWTAAREELPVTFVVMNNREYNVLKSLMRSQPGYLSARSNRFIGMDIAEPVIDYVALAGSMGVPARQIGSAADIAPAVEAAIASGRTSLLEVTISAG